MQLQKTAGNMSPSLDGVITSSHSFLSNGTFKRINKISQKE